VRALAVAGSNVYLGGDFTSVNGSQTRNHAAAVDATIGNVTGWNPNVECSSCGPGPTVASLAVSGKTVFLGGDFAGIDSINGTQTRTNLAQVDATTGIATDFNPTPDGQVNALGADGGGGVVAGGSFNAFDQDVQEGIAVFNVAPSNVARPTIAGKRTVGSSLLCGQGAWAGTKPQTYAYQWVLDVRAIPGAKGARYKLTNASAGHRISCQVVATNLGGSASAQSAPVSIPAIRAPVISRLKIKPTRIVAAATGSSIATTRKARSATGATVSYTDTQAATTRFAVFRLASGVKQGKRCVKPQARKPSKPKPACTRYLLLGNFTHTDVAGRNSFHFTGRVGGHKLVVGSYRLTATPRARGRSGRAVNVLFDVISSPKRPAKESLAATVVLIASAMLG
jgi:hypothetical protein